MAKGKFIPAISCGRPVLHEYCIPFFCFMMKIPTSQGPERRGATPPHSARAHTYIRPAQPRARDLYYPFERDPRDTPRARPRAMTAMFGEICALYGGKKSTHNSQK